MGGGMPARRCSQCGNEPDGADHFCRICDHLLSSADELPPVPASDTASFSLPSRPETSRPETVQASRPDTVRARRPDTVAAPLPSSAPLPSPASLPGQAEPDAGEPLEPLVAPESPDATVTWRPARQSPPRRAAAPRAAGAG